MGFEPMTNEFPSDALTDWAIRWWVQLALRTNFVQPLQFYFFVQCSHFISAISIVSCHICFKWNLAQVITLVAEWIDTYGIHHWKISEVTIESWPEWDLNPWPMNSVHIYIYIYIYIYKDTLGNKVRPGLLISALEKLSWCWCYWCENGWVCPWWY